jgi:DNA-binding transcriptional regulator LsrR (DeoR family)
MSNTRSDDMSKLRNKIKGDLYTAGKTQQDLADAMGIGASALSIRLGRTNMKIGTIREIILHMQNLTGVTYTILDFLEE